MAAARGARLAAGVISVALHLALAAVLLRPPPAGTTAPAAVDVWLASAPPERAAPRAEVRNPPSPAGGRADTATARERTSSTSALRGEAERVAASASVSPAPPPRVIAPAAPSAAPTLEAEDPFDAYARLVWSRIDRHRPRSGASSAVVQVAFSLDPEGRLIALRLAASSGAPAFDRAAMRAVRSAAPFPRPPQGVDPARLEFRIAIRPPPA